MKDLEKLSKSELIAEIEASRLFKDSETNFKAIFDNTPDMYVSVSPDDATILLCNDTLLKETGYSRKEVIGSPVFKMYHDECMADVRTAFNQFVETGEVKNKELILKRKDGSKIDVSLNVYGVRDKAGKILYSMSSWRDITEQKKASGVLSIIYKKLTNTMANMTDGFVSLDTNWNYTYLNERAAEMVGRKPEELIGKHIWTEFPEGIDQPFYKNYYKAIETKQTISFEEYYSPWGLWFENRIIPSEDGLAIFFQDITERKLAEIELVKAKEIAETSKNYLDNIINNIGDPIFVKDDRSKLLLANDAFCSIFGLSRDQIIGKTLAEDVPETERENFLSIDNQVLSDGIENIKDEFLTVRDGKTKIITTRKTRYIDKVGKKHLVGIIHDITEQKQIEEELKESLIRERLMADIVRESFMGVAIGYPDGRLGMCNSAFQNITGYNEEELKSIDWNKKLTPHEWEESELAKLQELHKTKKPVQYEKEYIRKDGSRVPIELSVNPRFDDNGEVECYFAFVNDITERKLVEQSSYLNNKRYESLFNDSPIPLWEEDFTDLYSFLLGLNEEGHKNLHNYFENNPNELMKCAGMIKIIDVNQAAIDLHKAKSKEQLIGNLSATFTDNSFIVFKNVLLAMFEGKEIFESESEVRTLNGDLKYINIKLKIDQSQPGKLRALLATSDITRRKKAEQLVFKNKTRLDYALKSIETGAWELDLKTLGSWRSLKHDQIFGYKKPLDEWTYDMFLEHVVPEDRGKVNQTFQHALTTKTNWDFECQITRNDNNKVRWIWAKGNQKLNEENEPLKMFGVIQDITERKQTEHDLSDTQNNLLAIFNNTQDAQLLSKNIGENDFIIIAANNSYIEKINKFGLEITEEDIVGINLKELIINKLGLSHDVYDYTIGFYLKVLETQSQVNHNESFVLNKDNYYSETSYTPIFNSQNKMSFVLYNSHDITDRKLAEQAITLSNTRYKALFNDSPIPLWEEDYTELSTYLLKLKEKGHGDLLNYLDNNPDELIECAKMVKVLDVNQAAIDLHLAENKDHLMENLSKTFTENSFTVFKNELLALVEGKETFESESEVKTLQGDLKNIYLTLKIDQSQPDKIKGLLATSDITDRKQIELELLYQKEKAEESDRLKSAFLANMSHEIRTPMNGIMGFAELLKESELTIDQQKNYIDIIKESGIRMLNIINDIIDISKIEANLIKTDIQESNVNDQVEYIYTFFKHEVESKGLKFIFNTTLPLKEAVIKTDREKVFAILSNLVKNAIKYSNKGSVEFGYYKKGAFLEFYVKDTGIGIPKERIKAIFERFIQADIEDEMALQGAGLGLSITKSYVEMLGGNIWVESEEGVGSTFYFTLPYQTEKNEKDLIDNELVIDKVNFDIAPATLGLNILIAEDDEISTTLLTITIEKFSNKIITATNGFEAIEACRNNSDIDLILMDIKMPKMDGYKATKQIRQFNKDVIIIAQTAHGLTGDKEKALEAGCNDYIAKPMNTNTLLTLIQKYF